VKTPIIKHISQELTAPEDMEKSSMKMAFFAALLVFAAGIYISPFFSLICHFLTLHQHHITRTGVFIDLYIYI